MKRSPAVDCHGPEARFGDAQGLPRDHAASFALKFRSVHLYVLETHMRMFDTHLTSLVGPQDSCGFYWARKLEQQEERERVMVVTALPTLADRISQPDCGN